jgi:multidrug efflux system outer membrane protein
MERRPDLQTAALDVQAADDQYKIQRADLFPWLTVNGVHAVSKYPPNVFNFGGTGPGQNTPGSTGTNGSIFHFSELGIGISAYELDLFGRVRSLDHQRLAQFLGYQQTLVSVHITLIAQVANAYIVYLGHVALYKVTQDTLANAETSYKLIRAGVDHGTMNGQQLAQAETAVDTARANLVDYQHQLAQDANVFVVLTGGPLPEGMPEKIDLEHWTLAEDLVPGMPAEMLTRRPDVRAAEANLIAANANIGAARAAFFPKVTLTAAYGTASTGLSGLFAGGSDAWNFSPQISLPIFSGGANVANLDLAKVEKNSYIAQYQKVIQAAFEETANALVGRKYLNEQLAAQEALVQAAKRNYELADLRFRHGVDSYLNVLDAQRTLYGAQQGIVAVRVARLQNLITLYKALGGGWKEKTVPAQAASGSTAPLSSAASSP